MSSGAHSQSPTGAPAAAAAAAIRVRSATVVGSPAESRGRLYLGVNDNQLSDNSGSLTATASMSSTAP